MDANGGRLTDGYPTPENASVPDGGTQIILTWSDLVVNADIVLPLTVEDKDIFTKDNAVFLGWAFNADATVPVFFPGQRIGVDNINGNGYSGENTNTLYAVWHLESVPVRIRKVDKDSTSTPLKDAVFTLNDFAGSLKSGDDGYLITNDQSILSLNTPSVKGEIATYLLTEVAAPQGYKVDGNVTIKIDYEGAVTYQQGEDGIVQNATVVNDQNIIIVTNTKNRQPVKVHKVNEESLALADAVFSLYTEDEYAKNEDTRTFMLDSLRSGDGTEVPLGEVDLGELTVGKYYLIETEAPAGYNLLDRPVIITVESTRVYATLGSDSTAANISEWDATGEYWKLTVHNNPGVSLPSTGGPGPRLLYFLGTLLVILARAGLVMRKRRRLF